MVLFLRQKISRYPHHGLLQPQLLFRFFLLSSYLSPSLNKMTRHTPFLCNHCFKWNTSYTIPICWQCNHRRADTCFPSPTLLLNDQYVFTVDEYREHSEFPIKQREELRTLEDAYYNAIAQEVKEIRESHTPKSKLRALFKGGRGADEQESVHEVYLARKKEIMERKEERHFLKGVRMEELTLNRRVTGDAWQMELPTLIVTSSLMFLRFTIV